MAGQRNTGGSPAPQEAQEARDEQPTMPLPVPASKPDAWHQRIAALLPTQALAAIARPPAARGAPAHSRGELARRWGLISLLAAILLAGGGALAALSHAPEDAAGQVCADALAGRYGAAYDLLGTAPRAQVSRANLARIGQALDAANGRVTSCMAASYAYTLGSGQAAIGVRIVRASGQSVSGQVEMSDENGWKVATLSPNLSGASLGALDTALRFCDALRAGDSSGLLALTSGDASAGLGGAQQLAANLSTWQQVDGPVKGCTLAGTDTGAGAGVSDTTAQVTLSVTRAGRGTAVAALSLADESPGWRVTTIGANLLGSDLGPLAVGQRFCAALASGDYAGAYALFSPSYAAQVSPDQFSKAFAPLGGTWSCTPRLSTYSVSGASGSYEVTLTLNGTGEPLTLTATLRFSLTNGVWAIQAVEPHGQ